MTILQQRIFARLYRDSVELMAIASAIESREGIDRVGAVMATPANLTILSESAMLPAGIQTAPDDLIIVVRGTNQETVDSALDEAEARLTAVPQVTGAPDQTRPRTIAEAVTTDPAPTLATISVPGEFAAVVGEQALRHGLHVFCFSDNVPLADEVRLKQAAAAAGQLFMGPDCGTAIIDGVPLGFANQVRPGTVGMVAASGTGAQEISTLLHRAGAGVSQLIGVGGRDLSEAVDATMTRFALDLLAADEATGSLVVVSKPPAASVSVNLLAQLDRIATDGIPVVACLLGEEDTVRTSGVVVRGTLEGGAIAAAAAAGFVLEPAVNGPDTVGTPAVAAADGRVLGLYTGGTLASEARVILERARCADGSGVNAEIIDLGDDRYTAGRPHPMIDPTLRSHYIAAAGADPGVAVLLIDLVLGHGAHADPATAVATAVSAAMANAQADGRTLRVIGSVCGTDADRQSLDTQRSILAAAGVVLVDSNAGAARLAARSMGGNA